MQSTRGASAGRLSEGGTSGECPEANLDKQRRQTLGEKSDRYEKKNLFSLPLLSSSSSVSSKRRRGESPAEEAPPSRSLFQSSSKTPTTPTNDSFFHKWTTRAFSNNPRTNVDESKREESRVVDEDVQRDSHLSPEGADSLNPNPPTIKADDDHWFDPSTGTKGHTRLGDNDEGNRRVPALSIIDEESVAPNVERQEQSLVALLEQFRSGELCALNEASIAQMCRARREQEQLSVMHLQLHREHGANPIKRCADADRGYSLLSQRLDRLRDSLTELGN